MEYVYLDPIQPHDTKLLVAAGEKLLRRPPTRVWARTLGRFGYSGNRLYVARYTVSDRPGTMSSAYRRFAIKIGTGARIKREASPYPEVASRLSIHWAPAHIRGVEDRALGVELFDDQDGEVTELRDLLFVRRKGLNVPALFSRLYERTLEPLHAGHVARCRSWRRHYRLGRARHLVRRRLVGLLGDEREADTVLGLYEDIRQERVKLLCGPIHGDLHSSNVVLVAGGEGLRLIDFAKYSESGHLLKDFVLMECSVRFHRFPRSVDFQVQQAFDRLLLRRDSHAAANRAVAGNHLETEYLRLSECVRRIRASAQYRSGESWNFEDYKKAQFLMLCQMMQYESYLHPAARAVLQLAKDLQ